jgi:predicted flap endonuclease-1-like 5' DNA nuclease
MLTTAGEIVVGLAALVAGLMIGRLLRRDAPVSTSQWRAARAELEQRRLRLVALAAEADAVRAARARDLDRIAELQAELDAAGVGRARVDAVGREAAEARRLAADADARALGLADALAAAEATAAGRAEELARAGAELERTASELAAARAEAELVPGLRDDLARVREELAATAAAGDSLRAERDELAGRVDASLARIAELEQVAERVAALEGDLAAARRHGTDQDALLAAQREQLARAREDRELAVASAAELRLRLRDSDATAARVPALDRRVRDLESALAAARQGALVATPAGAATLSTESDVQRFQARLRELDAAAADNARLRERLARVEADLAACRNAAATVPADRPRGLAALPPPDLATGQRLLGRPLAVDDLTVIAGIDGRLAELLGDAGVRTWTDLAAAEPARLRAVLGRAGLDDDAHDPVVWGRQARLLVLGEWEAFRDVRDRAGASSAS